MAKLNNKGFSLIDLLIAIAVMALLVSPIIAQLGQTLDLSAEAKEKQYVVDSANEVLEYFRKYDDSELAVGTDLEGLFQITSVFSGEKNCLLYSNTGSQLTWSPTPGSTKNFVKYNYKIYEITDATGIGKGNDSYKRRVVRSNLQNKLYEAGFQIDYSMKANSTLPSALSTKGFTFRSDNALVAKSAGTGTTGFSDNSEVYDDSLIGGIVVQKRTDLLDINPTTGKSYFEEMALKDPNEIDLGNMQDIDASKMAIIPGDATSLDYQLETDLTAALIQFVTKNPSVSYGVHADDPELLSQDMKNLVLNSSVTTKSRDINLQVTCGKDDTGALALDGDGMPLYYHVRCDVIYRISFNSSELKIFNNYTSNTGSYSYNVLDRDYYVNTPPDVLMVYEPLLVSTSASDGSGGAANVYYGKIDFLSIVTDKYTSCVKNTGIKDAYNRDIYKTEKDQKPSRLYLIRSVKNWQQASGAITASESDITGFYDPSMYFTYDGGFTTVNINVNQLVASDISTEKPIDIYTNISKLSLYSGHTGKSRWNFTTNNNTGAYPYPTIPTTVMPTYTRKSYDTDFIKPVNEETGDGSNRLGQFTVTYQKLSSDGSGTEGEVTYFTGARGAD